VIEMVRYVEPSSRRLLPMTNIMFVVPLGSPVALYCESHSADRKASKRVRLLRLPTLQVLAADIFELNIDAVVATAAGPRPDRP